VSAPWLFRTKIVVVSAPKKNAIPCKHVPSGFAEPAITTALDVPPFRLALAIAKMQALVHPRSRLISIALVISASALTRAIVDDVGTGFDLAAQADDLEVTARSSLAGAVGVGICHLFMESLTPSYSFLDHAANLIAKPPKKSPTSTPPPSTLGDFIYAAPTTSGLGAVLVEAKGHFSGDIGITNTALARRPYIDQVKRYVHDTTNTGLPIVHGYSVAFGARLPSVRSWSSKPTPNAFIVVAQTSHHSAAGAVGGPATPGRKRTPSAPPGATSTNPSGGGRVRSTVPVPTSIALANYRAAFMLAQAPVIVDMIDIARDGRELIGSRVSQRFSLIESDIGTFVRGADEAEDAAPVGVRFGVEAHVAIQFLNALASMLRTGSRPPTIDLDVQVNANESDERTRSLDAVLGDGLAMILGRKPTKQNALEWSIDSGLS